LPEEPPKFTIPTVRERPRELTIKNDSIPPAVYRLRWFDGDADGEARGRVLSEKREDGPGYAASIAT
jgi:hypothetical protein